METNIQKQLDRIEALTLLSAKSVFCFDEAVIFTGLSKSFLYKLTSSKQIPHYKPQGKQVYFDKAELENWLKQNRVQTTAEVESAAAAHNLRKGHKK